MDDESILRLLIVENSRNAAQVYIRALRNARVAVRPEIAEDSEDLEELLDKQTFDLVLAVDAAEGLPLGRLFQVLKQRAPELGVVVATDEFDTDRVLRALRQGAVNVIDKNSADHLQIVVTREAGNLKRARALADATRQLDESEQRCHDLLGSSRDSIAYVHEGMHIYANPTYLELFGYENQEQVAGVPLMDMVGLSDHETLKEQLRQFSRQQTAANRLDVTGLRQDGGKFPARMEFSAASYDGEPCMQIIIRDDTTNIELEQKLDTLTKQDVVTGLYNSIFFTESISDWLAQPGSPEQPATLIYIAIDDFKSVRESVGIGDVDQLLRNLADLLAAEVDSASVLARLGDKLFALFMPETTDRQAEQLAEKMRAKIEETLFEIGSRAVSLTCSFGICPVERGGKSTQEFLVRADIACETALAEGGNRLHLHNPLSYARASKERDELMIEMIKQAGKEGRFRLFYQPIVSLTGGTDETYEVFLRMLDENGEFVPPLQFIPAAERSGQIADIERWVIANSLQILSKRLKSGKQTTLFINVSGVTLSDAALLPWFAEQLRTIEVMGSAMVFELSELDVVNRIVEARQFCRSMRDLGCRIALDHFGSTTNSFNTLKQIPASYLKLDRSFITGMQGSTATDKIKQVHEVVARAHSLEKLVIAEFVEDAGLLSTLWQCQIDYLQGYFLLAPSATMTFDFEGESL